MPKKKSTVDPKLQARLDAKVRPDEPVKEDRIYYNMKPKKKAPAIKPEHVKNYYDLSKNGQLKFVVNGTKQCWEEVEDVIGSFRAHGINFPTWIMPVSATKEGQEAVDLGRS